MLFVAYFELFWGLDFVCVHFWKTDSELQFAAFRISSVVIPPLAAVEADALRVECAPNDNEYWLACSNIVLNHLAIVLDVTALCGLIIAINNLNSLARRCFILSMYVLSVSTRQRQELSRMDGKKNSAIGFPWRDRLARVEEEKAIPWLFTFILFTSSLARSATCTLMVWLWLKETLSLRSRVSTQWPWIAP